MVIISQSISSATEEWKTEYDDHCTICLEDLTSKVREMPCKHSFHSPCIESWLLRSESCPLCRRPFLSRSNLTRRILRLAYAYFANMFIFCCWITGWLCAWLLYLNLAICPIVSSICPLYPFEKSTWIISSLFLGFIVFLVTIHPCRDDRRADQVTHELEGNVRT